MADAETNHVVRKRVVQYRPSYKGTIAPAIPGGNILTPRASRIVPGKQEAQKTRFSGENTRQRLFFQPESLSPRAKKRHFWHWVVAFGVTMIGMILLSLLLRGAWSRGTEIYNTLRYGMPRTTQVDAYVGQETGKTPSHFIAENLRGRVLIIEYPNGDVQHARIIVGPQIAGSDADQVPVLLSFVDRNGNHHKDMLVQFGSTEIWYANEHGTFVPQ